MTRSRLGALALVLSLSSVGPAPPARAQYYGGYPGSTMPAGDIEGFTVTGKGTVAATPNLVEIDLEVGSASELTADAIVKYRDAKKRLRDAFAALKLDDVTVEERGLLVDKKGQMNPYYFNGMPPAATKAEVQLTRRLVVRCANIRGMDEDRLLQLIAKLLDVAQDAGARVGKQFEYNPYYYDPSSRFNTGLVRFIVDDYEKLQEEAYEKAIADARARAERLARLSRVELGPVVAAREVVVPSDRPPSPDEEPARKRLETPKFQEIPVRVELMVRFGVPSAPAASPAPAAAPAGAGRASQP